MEKHSYAGVTLINDIPFYTEIKLVDNLPAYMLMTADLDEDSIRLEYLVYDVNGTIVNLPTIE